MLRDIAALTQETFDLLVIGGGIFGAGAARDAALRGLRVALVDKSDFASGTSSKSSKLIHGGFRYLEQYDFGLVAESCRERRILREIAPHRVRPLPLLLPVYARDKRPLWLLRMGMTLYDALAMYRNIEPHRTLARDQAIALEPTLRPEGLVGAIRFFDCQEDDARFCIDNILHASQLGAVCANYSQVTALHRSAGRVDYADVRDFLSGATFQVRAKVFINAAGPWVEQVAGLLDDPHTHAPHLSPTKGVHLLLPRLTQSHGIFFQGRCDSRMMFVLPWHDCTLIGTTDTDYAGDPAAAQADEADIAYLLAEAQALFPHKPPAQLDIITTFAGIRPLLASDAHDPSSRSRDHQILRRGENLLSLAGGKYTTYRLIARQAIDAACRVLGYKPPKCRTATTPIPNPRPAPTGEKIADAPEIYASDIEHAVKNEMAITAEDIMHRRTGLAISRFGGPATADKVRKIVARLSAAK